MALPILLITESQLKTGSIIEQNVDPNVLQQIIFNVQDLQLKPILGKLLYDKIQIEVKHKIDNNAYEYSDYYSELIKDIIKPFLINACTSEFIVLNNFKLSNKGVMKLNDNSASNTSTADLEYIKNYYDNYTAMYKKRLIDFLSSSNTLAGGTDTNVTSEGIGWYLESDRGCHHGFTYESLPSNPTTPTDPDEPQDLQNVTDEGNTTTNDIISIGQKSIRVKNNANSASAAIAIGSDNLPLIELNKDNSEDKVTIRMDNISSESTLQLPRVNGTLAASVNGQAADIHGNINIAAGGDLQSVTDEGNSTTQEIIIVGNDDEFLKLTPTFDGEPNPRVIFQRTEGSVGIRAANVNTDYDVTLPNYAGGGSANLPLSVNGDEADGTGNITLRPFFSNLPEYLNNEEALANGLVEGDLYHLPFLLPGGFYPVAWVGASPYIQDEEGNNILDEQGNPISEN